MFLGQGTSGKVNNNSENNLRVFINGHFATNSMFSVVAGLKVTVVLQRFFFLTERKRIGILFLQCCVDSDDKTSRRSIEDRQQKKHKKF